MFYLVTGQRRGQRRKGILEVVCEEDMHVDYVPVIQSSAFKPGSGSFQTVQSRTWSQGFNWIFPHNAFVAIILQSIHALGIWRNKILEVDLLFKWLAYLTSLQLGQKLNSSGLSFLVNHRIIQASKKFIKTCINSGQDSQNWPKNLSSSQNFAFSMLKSTPLLLVAVVTNFSYDNKHTGQI